MDLQRDQLYYLIKDINCSEAIEEFKKTTSVTIWMHEDDVLYKSIIYGLEGLPKIIDSNFEGEYYKILQKFGRPYEMICSLFE